MSTGNRDYREVGTEIIDVLNLTNIKKAKVCELV